MVNNRKYKTDPELLLAQGKAIVATEGVCRYRHKVEMVNLVLGGLTPSFLAKYSERHIFCDTGCVYLLGGFSPFIFLLRSSISSPPP